MLKENKYILPKLYHNAVFNQWALTVPAIKFILGIVKRYHPLFIPFTLFLIVLILHFPHKDAGFVIDAHYVVGENPIIKQSELYPRIFNSGLFDAYESTGVLQTNYYRPMTLLSYIVDYQLWGMKAFGYRLTNIFLHFLNALLIFIFIGRLFNNKELAALTAFLFCILPAHEWIVRYVVSRSDLLQTFFSLLTLTAFHLFTEKRKPRWLILSLAAFACSLLSREASLILPLYIGLIYFHRREFDNKLNMIVLCYFLISLVYFFIRMNFIPFLDNSIHTQISIDNIIAFAANSIEYLFRLLIPWAVLSHLPAFFKHIVFAGSALFIFSVFAVISNKEKPNPVAFGLLWILLSLPVFFSAKKLILLNGPYNSEHFLYSLAIGFCLALSALLLNISAKAFRQTAIICVSCFYIAITVMTNYYWQSEYMLLKQSQALEKNLFTVNTRQLLLVYEENEQAILNIVKKIKKPGRLSLWYRRLGDITRDRGEFDKSIDYYLKAIAHNKNNIKAINGIAVCYHETGKAKLALKYLEQSYGINPQFPGTNQLLGIYHYRQKDFDKSIQYFAQAVYANPEDSRSHFFLAMAYFFNNDAARCQAQLKIYSGKFPDVTKQLTSAAMELYKIGYYNKAIQFINLLDDDIKNEPLLKETLSKAQSKIN